MVAKQVSEVPKKAQKAGVGLVARCEKALSKPIHILAIWV